MASISIGKLSVRADAIPKVLNVGDNLTINCTAEGFPKPLTDLDINYGVNDSEYHYSHRKGDVFYFDEVILPSASYKCSACQYVVISSNGKRNKISARTEIADVEGMSKVVICHIYSSAGNGCHFQIDYQYILTD